MRLACPYCGERPLEEFAFRATEGAALPALGGEAEPGAWVEAVYLRANPMGEGREHWQHLHGCRAWLVVTRSSLTHEVASVALARDARAGAPA